MFQGMYAVETERALADRAAHPIAPPRREPSIWAKAGELVAAPYKGAAQGVNEQLRSINAVVGQVGVSSIDPREDLQGYLAEKALSREGADAADPSLRSAVEFWKADPATASWASNLLHEGARFISKAAGYNLAGGVPGMVAGTTIDEGITGYKELRDQGVDAATAAKIGATRAGVTAISMAIPAAAATKAGTAGLVVASGPGAHVAEQYTSRGILERANYPELAAQHDPWDPAGLLLSLVPGAAVGVAVHAGRGRAARAPEPTLADVPEVREAAHVSYQRQVLDAGMLAERTDVEARIGHERALQEARAALDEGRALELGDVRVSEPRARAVAAEVASRLRAADATLPRPEPELAPALVEPVSIAAADPVLDVRPGADAEPVNQGAQRVDRIVESRPDLPVRLDDDGGKAMPAREVLQVERQANAEVTAETRRAFDAAIECFLSRGIE